MAGAKFKDFISCSDKYTPSFKITTKENADEYFASCVEHTMRLSPDMSEEKAIEIEKNNIGYFAGYTDNETRARIENLFGCEHPILGSVNSPLPPEVILNIGKAIGEAAGGEEEITITKMKEISKSIRDTYLEKSKIEIPQKKTPVLTTHPPMTTQEKDLSVIDDDVIDTPYGIYDDFDDAKYPFQEHKKPTNLYSVYENYGTPSHIFIYDYLNKRETARQDAAYSGNKDMGDIGKELQKYVDLNIKKEKLFDELKKQNKDKIFKDKIDEIFEDKMLKEEKD